MIKLIYFIIIQVIIVLLLSSCKKPIAVDTTTIPPVTIPPIEIPLPTVYPGYMLLWNDEFNGSEVDVQKWNFETGTGVNGDFGTGQLDRATDRSQNVKIESLAIAIL